jgi:hypothetical protein
VYLVHVPLFGLHQDVDVSIYLVRGKPRPPSEIPRLDGLDQSGDDRVVQAHVIEVREPVHGGALIEAVGMRGGLGG